MPNTKLIESDPETSFQYYQLENIGFAVYAALNLTCFDYTFGPDAACYRCKAAPSERGDDDERCTACREADEAKHDKDMGTRRVELAKAMRHLRHARRALERMAAASSSVERERLKEDAGYCHGVEITLDFWRQDYRGGCTYRPYRTEF